MGLPNPGELIIIGCVIALLFGAKKIPEFASGLGEGIKEFKKAIKDENVEKTEVAQPQTVDAQVVQQHTQATTTVKTDNLTHNAPTESLKDIKNEKV